MTETSKHRRQARLLALMVWPSLAVLIGLGSWQLQRLGWKTDLIAKMTARIEASAVPLPADVSAATIDDLEFTQVRVTGRFRHADEMVVLARPRKGEAGSRVVTPMETEDGRWILIDRGWIPIGAEDPARRSGGQITGSTSVEGLLRAPPQTNLFTPNNRPEENVWYWIDPAAMAERAGFAPQPFFVEAGPAPNPGGLPVGGRPVLDIPNNHLQYAITWFGLAAGLLAVYVIYRRSERRRSIAER